ncbi:MAG: hypothetical protein GX038_00175 [Erysipelothrix sp.]|nr:hypothetical protein [Erysipelothrix sp.]
MLISLAVIGYSSIRINLRVKKIEKSLLKIAKLNTDRTVAEKIERRKEKEAQN